MDHAQHLSEALGKPVRSLDAESTRELEQSDVIVLHYLVGEGEDANPLALIKKYVDIKVRYLERR
jgi:hypothetical protein